SRLRWGNPGWPGTLGRSHLAGGDRPGVVPLLRTRATLLAPVSTPGRGDCGSAACASGGGAGPAEPAASLKWRYLSLPTRPAFGTIPDPITPRLQLDFRSCSSARA